MPPRQKRSSAATVPLPRRLADTTVALLTIIRRHQRIHDFCLRTAAALMKLPGGARLVRTIQETQQPSAAPYTEWIARFDTLSESDRRAIALHIDRFPSRPTFSVIMPIFTDNASHLRAGIESVQRQLYPATELCIALGQAAPQSQAVRTLVADAAAADPRIRLADAVADTRDAAVTKAALSLASGEFAVLFDPRHLLSERALYEMAAEIVAHPDADILFSDEDHVDDAGQRHQPIMKTGWNPEMMLSHDMVGNLKVVRRSLIESIGGVRAGFRGCRDYDLVLRASAATTAQRIRHLPLVLHHSRRKTDTPVADSLDHDSALQVVTEHLTRTGQAGATVAPLSRAPGWLEVRRTVPSPAPLVSVIIPTRDRADVLGKCLGGLLVATDYPALEVIVADNDSCEPATFRLFDRLACDPRVRILPCPGPFNYSAINNTAIAQSRGEILLLLNNDILIRQPDWLTNMVAQAVRPEVGAVGARLLYENGTIQHAGVILGVGAIEPVAGHVYERVAADAPGHLNHLRIARNTSAVTAACLAMRRTVFDEVGGFDEKNLPVAFNDVDLCLKVGQRGYQIICTPQAELTHLESISRGSDLRPEAIERFKRDIAHMKRTWGRQIESDPHYGPNFHKVVVDYSLAFPPSRQKTWLREYVAKSTSEAEKLANTETIDSLAPSDKPADQQPLRSTVLAQALTRSPRPRIAWTSNALLDRDRKFAMLFSEKSACTSAVIWFCHTLGLADEARAYSEWPHDYRLEVLNHPDARLYPHSVPLDGYTILQIVRDPFERAASSFRHAVGSRYADKTIKMKIGVDVANDGLSFTQFIDFLAKENLRFCNPHHRVQSYSIAPGRFADVVINISRQDLYQELNAFEVRMGMPLTDFANLAWVHELQKTRSPTLVDMGPNPDQIALTVTQAQRGPWPKGLLTERARRRIQTLYADDIARYS
jgi:GT2 family glycosyltransferase